MLNAIDKQIAPQTSTKVKVAPVAYEGLAEILDRTVRRHDYDPDRELLVIRMPSPIHKVFSASLGEFLRDELSRIAHRQDEAGEFATQIESARSSRIFLRERTSETGEICYPLRRQPDEQFQHKSATYPGVVIEVSYSQDGRNLRRLAQEYILYSNGDIKLVIGIDINDEKDCTVSLWRPRYTRQKNNDHDDLEVVQEMTRRVGCPLLL
jgi:hypothetical protein